MEKSVKQKTLLTKGKNAAYLETAVSSLEMDGVKNTPNEKTCKGMFLSPQDAEEYRAYKRRKKVEEIMSAIAKSEASLLRGEDPQRVCERAIRLKQAAVKAPPTWLPQAKIYLGGSKVKIDCVIGGNGETLTKVKIYEMRVALRSGAKELTVVIAPSLLSQGKFAEIKKELKKLSRIAKRVVFKVWIHSDYSFATLSKTARICCETGVKYFCVPYFAGCEKLRFDLTNGCQMEILEVENLADYRKLCEAGVGRIVTRNVWEIYCEWMKEADKIKEDVDLPQGDISIKEMSKNTMSEELKTSSVTLMPPLNKEGEKVDEKRGETKSEISELPTEKTEKKAAPTAIQVPLEAEMRTGILPSRLEGSDLKFL